MWKMILVLRSVMVRSFFTLQRHQPTHWRWSSESKLCFRLANSLLMRVAARQCDMAVGTNTAVRFRSKRHQAPLLGGAIGVIFIGIGFYCKLGYKPQNRGCIPASSRNCIPKSWRHCGVHHAMQQQERGELAPKEMRFNHGQHQPATFVHGWILQAITESMEE